MSTASSSLDVSTTESIEQPELGSAGKQLSCQFPNCSQDLEFSTEAALRYDPPLFGNPRRETHIL
jgi:hypothetical protein